MARANISESSDLIVEFVEALVVLSFVCLLVSMRHSAQVKVGGQEMVGLFPDLILFQTLCTKLNVRPGAQIRSGSNRMGHGNVANAPL